MTGWDFLPGSHDYEIVLLSGQLQRPKSWRAPSAAASSASSASADSSDSAGARDADDDGESSVWNANSQLQRITPFGGLTEQLVRGCTGAAANYNQLTHELAIDRNSADLSALVGVVSVRAYPNTTLPWTGAERMRHAHVGALLGRRGLYRRVLGVCVLTPACHRVQ